MAALFCVSRPTVSEIFKSVLDKLYFAANDLLFWFSKCTILARMPLSFKENYPNWRVIIDATEVKTEKPKTQQQVQLYSNYKSGACNLSKKKKPRALLQALGFCFGTDVSLGLLMMAKFFSPLFIYLFIILFFLLSGVHASGSGLVQGP